MDVSAKTVGRFAPSPSGRMHVGNVFALLMAWLGARSAGGKVVLRIENLDPRASKPELAKQLIDDILWLGLSWDEGPFWQSDRLDIYQSALDQLEEKGLVYPCFCTRAELHAASAPHASDGSFLYPGTCKNLSTKERERLLSTRQPAKRLCVPNENISFVDAVFGQQNEVLARDCGDFLIQRSDGVFAYQLAVAVDDALMGVTQVVRGRDLLGSTARQMYIQRELGLFSPAFAHIPLLVAPSGRRLSKRDKDLDLGTLQAQGMSPERLLSSLAALVELVEKNEVVGTSELIERFSWEKLAQHREDIVVDSGFLR